MGNSRVAGFRKIGELRVFWKIIVISIMRNMRVASIREIKDLQVLRK